MPNLLRPIVSDPSKIDIVYDGDLLKVYTHDIPNYVSVPFYHRCLDFYHKTKKYGSPWLTRGWCEWPCWAHDILDIIEIEERKYTASK